VTFVDGAVASSKKKFQPPIAEPAMAESTKERCQARVVALRERRENDRTTAPLT